MAGVITEIAIECGVSEQAVRAWCRRNHVAKDAKGSFAISESQKTAIYQHYLGVERKQVSQQAKASCETCETTLIAMLQGELDRKSEQLAVKDKQIKKLKAMAVRGAEAEQKVKKQQQTIDRLEAENASLQRQLKPSVQKRMKEMQEMSELREQNRDLQYETQWLEQELERERSFSARLMRGINMALIYLEEHLPDNLRPLLDKVREILPEWEQTEQRQQQTHDRGMGGMSL